VKTQGVAGKVIAKMQQVAARVLGQGGRATHHSARAILGTVFFPME
jgi:hypothetical protein